MELIGFLLLIIGILGLLFFLLGSISPRLIRRDTKKGLLRNIFLSSLIMFIGIIVLIVGIENTNEEKRYASTSDKAEVIRILNAISSDMNKIEESLDKFQNVLQDGDIYDAIRIAEYNKQNTPINPDKNYIKDKNTEVIASNLVDKFNNSNSYLQLYYNSFVKYANDQKPSLLVDVQDYLNLYNAYKAESLSLLVTLGGKYSLEFDSNSSSWKNQKPIKNNSENNSKTTAKSKRIASIRNTIAGNNISGVIESLKTNYDIDVFGKDDDGVNNFKEICWNVNSCEIEVKTVQIQAIRNSVEVLTSSQVSPEYYQSICSAIMIALTGADKSLVEEIMLQYFDYASINGRTRWENLGIEITISPDSMTNLLGCSFYRKN